jgi:hypothetical protein
MADLTCVIPEALRLMAAPVTALLETVVSSLSSFAALVVVSPWFVRAVPMCVMPEALMLMEEPDLALLEMVVLTRPATVEL